MFADNSVKHLTTHPESEVSDPSHVQTLSPGGERPAHVHVIAPIDEGPPTESSKEQTQASNFLEEKFHVCPLCQKECIKSNSDMCFGCNEQYGQSSRATEDFVSYTEVDLPMSPSSLKETLRQSGKSAIMSWPDIKLIPQTNKSVKETTLTPHVGIISPSGEDSGGLSMPSLHPVKDLFVCSHCDKGVISVSDLQEHMLTHKDDEHSACPHCDKEFLTLSDLKKHLPSHGLPPYLCPHCNRGFTTSLALAVHIRTHTGKKSFSCPLCGIEFTSVRRLSRHIGRHVGTYHKVNNTSTSLSPKDGKPSLEYGLTAPPNVSLSTSPEGNQPSQECVKPLTVSSKISGKKFDVCSQCQTIFVKSMSSKCDVCLSNEGKRPICCLECGKNFVNDTNLKRHVDATHNKKKRKKKYKCPSCHRQFIRLYYLNQHILGHLRLKGPYVCTLCGKGFLRERGLKKHKKLKPDNCLHCGKEFCTVRALKAHTFGTAGCKPYPCSYCPKGFNYSFRLKVHLLTHTRDQSSVLTPHCGVRSSAQKNPPSRAWSSQSKRTGVPSPYLDCELCIHGFTLKEDLDDHLVYVHRFTQRCECKPQY